MITNRAKGRGTIKKIILKKNIKMNSDFLLSQDPSGGQDDEEPLEEAVPGIDIPEEESADPSEPSAPEDDEELE